MTWLMGLIPKREACLQQILKCKIWIYMSNKHQNTNLCSVIHFLQSPAKRALFCDCLWQNILWYVYVLQLQHVLAVSHFVLGNQCVQKAAEIFPFTWMQKSFQRIPSGTVHNDIGTRPSLKSQMLTVSAFGERRDSGDILTNVYLTSLLPPYQFTGQVSPSGLQSQWC